MRRLVCVVEGKGEVKAIPNLCARILLYLEATDWIVDQDPIKQPRSRLVDERVKSPSRPAREEMLRKAIALARTRSPNAIIVLCDSDDDCAAIWGPDATRIVRSEIAGEAVMAVREYESWFLAGVGREDLDKLKIADPEKIRDAKGAVERLHGTYRPTVHQLEHTRRIDIEVARQNSRSFDKLVRSVALACDVTDPGAHKDKKKS